MSAMPLRVGVKADIALVRLVPQIPRSNMLVLLEANEAFYDGLAQTSARI